MMSEDTKTKKQDGNKGKLCAVCGDKALGYNFNAMTCESCKAFFRRNALKPKEFKCPFSNSCEVTTVTRRFCQKCRLKKCFDIGMKKEWILSDEEKFQKRQKIEENRAKKRHHQDLPATDQCGDPASPASASSSLPATPAPLISTEDSDLTSAASVLLDLHPSMLPLAPSAGPSQLTVSNERPKARVLPSTRSAEIVQSSRKVKKVTDEAKVFPFPPTTSDHVNGGPIISLIKQELMVSPPTTPFANLGQDPQQQTPLVIENSDQPLFEQISFNSTQATNVSNIGPDSMSMNIGGVAGTNGRQTMVGNGHDIRSCGSGSSLPPTDHSIIPDFSQSHNLDDIIAVAIEAEFHAKSIQIAQQGNKEKVLTEQEKARMQELFMASRSLVEPLDLEKTSGEPNNLISIINLTDLAIKRIIRMAKKISPFINMCQEDQIALLKGGCTELMILRSVINFNPDKNSWRLPSKDRPRELNMELLKEASSLGVNLYEHHQRFVRSFDPKWRTDENVILLLSAIALFNPQRVNVLHSDVVKLEQDTYYYLLRRYLETVCEGCEPRRAYLHLISRLKDLQQLNDSHIQVFLEVNPKLVEPLLIEIFDLNPR